MSSYHILVTGPPGVGKTTVIKKVCELLKDKNIKFGGFFTEEVRNGRERLGFDIVTLSGQRATLARASSDSARGLPKVGKYVVHVPSFEELALPVFECEHSKVLVLDEIGKMELFSKSFLEKVKKCFDRSDIKVLATIPISKNVLPFVDGLRSRKDCILIEVTRFNRNDIPDEIIKLLC